MTRTYTHSLVGTGHPSTHVAKPLPSSCRMTTIAENLASTLLPATGGILMASHATGDMGLILGGAVAGAGVAGLLGMLLSESIPALQLPRLAGLRRLAANWLCGLCTIPFIGPIHRKYFVEEDLSMTSAGIAGVAGLVGVVVLAIVLPAVVTKARKKAEVLSEDERHPVKAAPDTVNLAPPKK